MRTAPIAMLALLLAGCALAEPAPVPPATALPTASATLTLEAAPTRTPAPTTTPAPTPTPEPTVTPEPTATLSVEQLTSMPDAVVLSSMPQLNPADYQLPMESVEATTFFRGGEGQNWALYSGPDSNVVLARNVETGETLHAVYVFGEHEVEVDGKMEKVVLATLKM